MPLPLVIAALYAGGSLVPHAAGGLIVSSTAGYVTGTYISTAAIATVLTTATTAATALGVGAAIVSGAASTIIGGAGIFGTTIGATGITGALMSAGILSSTPIIVPVLAGSALAGCGYASYRLTKLKRKLQSAKEGEELHFSDAEAKIFERFLKIMSKKDGG
jgi:hypothetical protein